MNEDDGAARTEQWLNKIAVAAGAGTTSDAYDAWAPTYDDDMLRTGYANLAIVAGLLCRYVPAGGTILDAGAGTGMLGSILHPLGYTDLVALDASAGMLARAAERGIYRETRQARLGEPLPFDDGAFAAAAVVGAFAPGHAPGSALGELIRVTRRGGVVAFNVNDGPWNAGVGATVEALEHAGRWERLERTAPFKPMARSATRGDVTGRAFAFRVR